MYIIKITYWCVFTVVGCNLKMEQNKNPEILYRYRPLSSSLANTLTEITGMIWLSRAEGLNDPFDGLNYAQKYKGFLREEKRLNIPIEHIWSIACFTSKWDNPTMWAHYADNYKGICLGYDKKELDNQINRIKRNINNLSYTTKGAFLNPMKYVTDIPKTFLSSIEPLTIKTKHWKYEKEWRIGLLELYGNANIKDNGTPHFIKNALKEIIYTEHIKRNELIIIKKLAKLTDSSIKFYKTEMNKENGMITRIETT